MQAIQKLLLVITLIIGGIQFNTLAQLNSSEIIDMSKSADLILTGKITSQNSSWNENQTRIYTYATIQVEEFLKGSSNGEAVVVSYPGGEVGDIGEVYSHMPRFENNEEVLVFLKKNTQNDSYNVVSGEDGKITVINDPKTGEKITTSNVQINSLKTQIKSYVSD